MTKWLLGALMLSSLAACTTTPPETLYYWGSYQPSLLGMYSDDDPMSLSTQIANLTLDLEQASNLNKALPPGFYAHLGMLHAMNGNAELAVQYYQEEKARFPESALLIDGMLERSGLNQSPPQGAQP